MTSRKRPTTGKRTPEARRDTINRRKLRKFNQTNKRKY